MENDERKTGAPGVEILRKLSLRVTDTEKTFLETAAGERGFRTLNKYLRSVLLPSQQVRPTAPAGAPCGPKGGPDAQLGVRITAQEKALFRQRCAEEGLTESDVLRRQIRIYTRQSPAFAGREQALLREANAELRRVGTDLTRLVKRLRTAPGGVSEDDLASIAALRDAVAAQQGALRDLIQSNLNRVCPA